jgi:hypothetical protein
MTLHWSPSSFMHLFDWTNFNYKQFCLLANTPTVRYVKTLLQYMYDAFFYIGLQQQSTQDIYNFLSRSSTELWILQVQFTL